MILKSFVLIEKEGSYLLIREAAKKWKGKWFLPGGKVEGNETPEKAAYREVKEEAGCNISLNGIFFLRYSRGFLDKQLSIFYSAKIIGKEIKQTADEHSLEAKWFSYEEITQLPLRQKLLELIHNYSKTNIIPVKNFKML